VREETYHATSVNPRSIGIEIKQGKDCELYEKQLAVVADLVDWITVDLGIQRQIPDRYRGALKRLEAGGADFYGVFGHRGQTTGRGAGDPGDLVMQELVARGYERFNLAVAEDRVVWKRRQRALGIEGAEIDGIPGPITKAVLRARGYAGGLWTLAPVVSQSR